MEKFIQDKVKSLVAEKKITVTQFKRGAQIKDHNTALGIIDGADNMKVSKLVDIANYFGVSCADFFESVGGVTVKKRSVVKKTPVEESLIQQVVDSERALYDLKEKYTTERQELEIAHLRELYDMRLSYEKQIADLRAELAEEKAKSDIYANEINIRSQVNKNMEGYPCRAAEEREK